VPQSEEGAHYTGWEGFPIWDPLVLESSSKKAGKGGSPQGEGVINESLTRKKYSTG